MAVELARLKEALAGRYTIEREIGSGGMATVYLATDVRHERQVAVKLLRPELGAVLGGERFLREIHIAAGLNHPHILALHDSGEVDGLLYYVMPYVEGESLRQRLDEQTQLSIEETLELARQVASALDYAHSHGVIHRDIKPENILLHEGEAMVADFGIARALRVAGGERLTETGLSLGTPAYMSPEQASGSQELDGRSDIYSLACVMYEMLAGDPPFTGPTAQAVIARHLVDPVPSLRTVRLSVPEELENAVEKALAKVPADRYETAGAFVESAGTGAQISAVSAAGSGIRRPRTWSRSKRRVVLALAGAVTVSAAVGAWYLSQQGGADAAGPSDSAPQAYEETQLTDTGNVRFPAISPDGRYLAFAVPDAGGAARRVVVRDMEGVQPDRTLAIVDELSHLDWLPDGSGVVLRGTYHGKSGFFSIPRTGGAIRSLPGRSVFSPDGSETVGWTWGSDYLLVFSSDPADMDSAGQARRLDSIPIAGEFEFIADVEYSPSGNHLAVATWNAVGAGEIRSVSRDGSEQRVMANAKAWPYSLHWQANGRALYYVRRFAYTWQAIMRLPTTPTGRALGQPQMLLGVDWHTHRSRYVTDDGLQLVVPREARETRIVLLRQVGSDSLHVEPIRGTEGTVSLYWQSPDGQSLAFWQKGALGVDLVVAPIDGGVPKQLTTSGTISYFDWSPGSDVLAFSTQTGDTTSIWFIPASGGRPTPLEGSYTWGQLWWGRGPLIHRLPDMSLWVADSLRVRFGSELLPLTASTLERPGGVVEANGRPLVTNDSVGVIHHPVHASPDGKWVAAHWDRSDHPGLWLISLTDSIQTLVLPDTRSREHFPVGWTPDGQGIFYRGPLNVETDPESGVDGIFLISIEGGDPELVLRLPRDPSYGCDPDYSGEELSFVCSEIIETSSDAWLVKGFERLAD